jgi:hypothetical protein
LRRQLPLLVPLTAIYLVVGVPMLGVLIHSFGVEIREALAVAAGLVAALVVALMWFSSRTQPSGVLRIEDGRLHFDAWRSGPVDAPVSAVRRAVILRYPAGSRPPVLVILLPRRRIYVHEPRLEARTLEEVLQALHAAMTESDRQRVIAASTATARRQLRVSAVATRVALVAGGIGAVLALLRLLLELG